MPGTHTDDYIEGHVGEESGNIVIGKGLRQRVDSPGGDAARDQQHNAGNQVHIAMERLSEVSELEAETISELSRQIGALTRALTGDPLRIDGVGLIQQVREMQQTNKSREWWRVLSTWMLFFLIVSQIAQGWLIYQVYLLYWAIYQAVQAVGG